MNKIKTLESLILPGSSIKDTGLASLVELPRLRELHIDRSHRVEPIRERDFYTDEGIRALSRLRSLETLHFGSPGITDNGIRSIVDLPRLRKLMLFGCDYITDSSLESIGEIQTLESLSVWHGKLTLSGLRALNNLDKLVYLKVNDVAQDHSGLYLPRLRRLEHLELKLRRRRIDGASVRDRFEEHDIAAMGQLTSLRSLHISHDGATNASLAALSRLEHLERLSIGGSDLTGEGLRHLGVLTKLTSLTLSGSFTNKALEYLQALQSLERLDFISGASFNPIAVRQFSQRMPNLVVFAVSRRPA